MRPLGETGDLFQRLLHLEGFRLLRGHVYLLVPFLGLAERAAGQLATLVGHEVAPLVEGKVVKVEHFPRTKLEKKNTCKIVSANLGYLLTQKHNSPSHTVPTKQKAILLAVLT